MRKECRASHGRGATPCPGPVGGQTGGVDAPPVIIIGAGLCGLVAANALSDAGRASIVVDKGRVPGGRLATRRLEAADGWTARLDHGAQFFTVRSPDFAEVVHGWRRAGLIREWCQGFMPGGDGHPRYCGQAGMNSIARWMASSVDVTCDAVVRRVSATGRGSLEVTMADGRKMVSDTVVMTPPIPQSLALLDEGGVVLPPGVAARLSAVRYARCLALLVALDGAAAVPEPGGVQMTQDEHPLFSFVADNARKGISDVAALTLHVHDGASHQLWDNPASHQVLLDAAQAWIGDAAVVSSEVKRWRYARPLVPSTDTHVAVELDGGALLVFAGDAFAGAKVEGAALSGLAAAASIGQ